MEKEKTNEFLALIKKAIEAAAEEQEAVKKSSSEKHPGEAEGNEADTEKMENRGEEEKESGKPETVNKEEDKKGGCTGDDDFEDMVVNVTAAAVLAGLGIAAWKIKKVIFD